MFRNERVRYLEDLLWFITASTEISQDFTFFIQPRSRELLQEPQRIVVVANIHALGAIRISCVSDG